MPPGVIHREAPRGLGRREVMCPQRAAVFWRAAPERPVALNRKSPTCCPPSILSFGSAVPGASSEPSPAHRARVDLTTLAPGGGGGNNDIVQQKA